MLGRDLVPHIGAGNVGGFAAVGLGVEASQHDLGVGVTLLGGEPAPLLRFLLVLGHPEAHPVYQRDVILRQRVALFGQRAKQF